MKRFLAIVLSLTLTVAMLSIPALSQPVDIETGEIRGAPFRIQIPTQWNRNLVMYTHAYVPRGMPWSPLAGALSAVFLERGFALAESGYSRQGWAVEEGVAETEALRQHFIELYGQPDSTFVAGHSLGGLIAIATIETYPDAYVGALPMCAPLVPAIHFFRDPVFDMLVTFEGLFGNLLPKELGPLVEAPDLVRQVVEHALESDPSLATSFAQHWDIRPDDLAAILVLYHLLYRELTDRAGGNPIDNRNTVYSGFGSQDKLNEAVRRYAAQPEAVRYTRRYYTPTGEIEDPVLAVHTTYDPGVPPRLPNYYDVTVTLRGNDEWFVQKYVEADGHCNIEPGLVGQAFDQLRAWTATGIRPESGLLR